MLAALYRIDWKECVKAGGLVRGSVWAAVEVSSGGKIWQTYSILQGLTQPHLVMRWLQRQKKQSCPRQVPRCWHEQHMAVPFNKWNVFKLRIIWNFELGYEKITFQHGVLMVTSFSDFQRIFSLVYESASGKLLLWDETSQGARWIPLSLLRDNCINDIP